MCNQLLDTCLSKAQTFETQGLFVDCATRLFNEYSGDCKKLLENLLTTIIKIQHKRKMKDGNFKNLVQMTKFKIIFYFGCDRISLRILTDFVKAFITM